MTPPWGWQPVGFCRIPIGGGFVPVRRFRLRRRCLRAHARGAGPAAAAEGARRAALPDRAPRPAGRARPSCSIGSGAARTSTRRCSSWSVSHIRRALGQQRADRHPIETVHGARLPLHGGRERRPSPPERGAGRAAAARRRRWSAASSAMAELRGLRARTPRRAAAGCACSPASPASARRAAPKSSRGCAERAGRAHALRAAARRHPAHRRSGRSMPRSRHAATTRSRSRARRADRRRDERGEASAARGDGARFRRSKASRDLLRELAAARPTLLVLDDLQWADAGTLQLLGFIAPELRASPLCIVATLRDSEREPGGARDRRAARSCCATRARSRSARSTREQVAELIFSDRRDHRPSAELAEAVRRASGGIPLFVQEVVRSLLREHTRADARPAAAGRGADPGARARRAAPAHPAAAASRRSSCCRAPRSSARRSICRCCALLLELEPEALLDRLAPAVADGLLESEAPHTYRFAHALFQSVLYDDLPAGTARGHPPQGGRAARRARPTRRARKRRDRAALLPLAGCGRPRPR